MQVTALAFWTYLRRATFLLPLGVIAAWSLTAAAPLQSLESQHDTLPAVQQSVVGRFSTASISGDYAFFFSVAVPSATSVDFISGTGVYHADGAGHLTGTETYNSTTGGGRSCVGVSVSGTYAVQPDGTGTAMINLSSPDGGCTSSFAQAIAVAHGGETVKATNIQSGAVLIGGEWTRQ